MFWSWITCLYHMYYTRPKWLNLTLNWHLTFPVALTAKMCEMFPVKRKPVINLDTVFFVWQPANVMYITGQEAMSLLLEKGWRGPWEKIAVLIPRTAVALWCHGQTALVLGVGRTGHLCVCVFVYRHMFFGGGVTSRPVKKKKKSTVTFYLWFKIEEI